MSLPMPPGCFKEQKNYMPCQRKNALLWSRVVEKWRQYLEGRPFVVLTDHAALTWVFNHPRSTSRLTRWTIRLQGFDFTVRYRKGRCNVVPDSLSRAMPEEEPLGCVAVCQAKDVNGDLPINWEELGQSQKSDQSLQPLWDEAKLNLIDPQQIHYVEQNFFLFRCIPDGKKGPYFASNYTKRSTAAISPVCSRQSFEWVSWAHENITSITQHGVLASNSTGCMGLLQTVPSLSVIQAAFIQTF